MFQHDGGRRCLASSPQQENDDDKRPRDRHGRDRHDYPDEQQGGGSNERGQGTIVDDTSPARPGLPPPNTVSPDSAQP